MTKKNLIIVLVGLFGTASAQDTTHLSMIFVGDIMQHDSQIRAAFNSSDQTYSYKECFKYIKPIIERSDLAFGNLELTHAGPPYKGYPQFSAPDQLSADLKDSGFDGLVTANNHSLDRRNKGLVRTIDVLDSLQLLHTGTFKDSAHRALHYPLLIEKNGIKISLLNYTFGTNGIPITPPSIVNLLDTVTIEKDIIAARAQHPDAIVAFVHWGAEYQSSPNREQRNLAAFFFNRGVKLLIGSHPHVLQPMYWNKEKDQLVAYSLGNFVSGQQSRYKDGGAMLQVELEKIVQRDSTSFTKIHKTNYDLVWVYRNNETPKKYFIVPTREFETDSLLLPADASARLKEFVLDSRKLFHGSENVPETDRALLAVNYFTIHLEPAVEPADSMDVLNFYGVNHEWDIDSVKQLVTDKFYDLEVARQALVEILAQTEFKDSYIMLHYWDRRIKLSPRKNDSN